MQSVPEPGLALLTMGKRDVGFDIHLPQPVWRYRAHATPQPEPTPKDWKITKLNDQHAYLSVPANANIAVGDLLMLRDLAPLHHLRPLAPDPRGR